MKNAWALCKREFASYFVTPIGYVILGAYGVISGLGFTINLLLYARVSQAPGQYGYTGVPDFEEFALSPFLVFCGVLFMFIGPLITMRLLAEEKNRGTMELLMTYPLRDRDVVFGKYAASLGMLLATMLVVLVYLIMVHALVAVEPAVLAFGLVTVFLMGAAFLSLGLFISAVARSQVTAGAMTFALWFVSYILGVMGEDLPAESPAPSNWPEAVRSVFGLFYHVFRQFVQELPLDAHAREMAQGVLQPRDIAYYVLFAAFFLFLTFRALESRRWRA